MDVVVKARHCTVSDQFRSYVDEKITRLEKLDDRAIRVEVEVSKERNKRQHDQACRVEITLRSKGPVIRAEAAAEDNPAAFDMALDKLMAQLRRAADRKRVHRGSRTPKSLQAAAADLPPADRAGPGTQRCEQAPGRRHRGRRRRPTGGPGEGPCRHPNDSGSGAARDGTGRPRLLPLHRRRARFAQRGLPSEGVRLRGYPAGQRHRAGLLTASESGSRPPSSPGWSWPTSRQQLAGRGRTEHHRDLGGRLAAHVAP